MTDASHTPWPANDLALSRRLERAEGLAHIAFIRARRRAHPAAGADFLEYGGVQATFDGATSPLTQTFCLGLFAPADDGLLDRLEAFYRERGAPVFHEVSPLADDATLALLAARGYRPVEYTTMLYQPLPARIAAGGDMDVGIMRADEAPAWTAAMLDAWRDEAPEFIPFLTDLAAVNRHRTESLDFIARVDGDVAGTASMAMEGGVASLAGAGTVPAFRRRGVQRALLAFRLAHAAASGCDLAKVSARPGSQSQRNAEANGFRVAYTRIKWALGPA